MNRSPLLIPRLDAVPPRPPLRERLQESFASLGNLLAALFHLALAVGGLWFAYALLSNVSFLRPLSSSGTALIRELMKALFN